MNHYPHHIGDYLRDASHLSLLEHGAYRRLLDVYYSTEKPLPIEVKAVCRLVGARSKEERDAVEIILADFFTKSVDGWHNKRCDEELFRYSEKSERNREVGKKGGRPRTQTEPTNNPDGFHESNYLGSENNPSHKPIANSHKPIANTVKSALPMLGDERDKEIILLLQAEGVEVRSPNPLTKRWKNEGVTDEILRKAVSIARVERGKADEQIVLFYLKGIVEDLINPPIKNKKNSDPATDHLKKIIGEASA